MTTSQPTDKPTSPGPTPPPRSCGNPAIKPDWPDMERVINGKETVPHSFPWQVALDNCTTTYN